MFVHPSLFSSVIAGLMWMTYDGNFNIRHMCEHGDGLQSFGWIKHDGVSFGQQDIVDSGECLFVVYMSNKVYWREKIVLHVACTCVLVQWGEGCCVFAVG